MRLFRKHQSDLKASETDSRSPVFDPEEPGSRFTSRIALAVSAMSTHGDRRELAGARESDIAEMAISDHLGADSLEPSGDAGTPVAVDGVVGRGAAAWVPVIEWAAAAVVGGVIQGAAWESFKATGRRLRDLLRRAKNDGETVYISRGAAAALAAIYVLEETEEHGVLDTEAVLEPSTLRGERATESSYVGLEPWIVSLLNEPRSKRYLVAVSSQGGIDGLITLPVGRFESMYSSMPSREHGSSQPDADPGGVEDDR
jgi:hypothetical protein